MAVEYKAQAYSPLVNGEVKLKVEKNSFTVIGLMEIAEIPFVSINAVEFSDYVVKVLTDEGDFVFSRMGSAAQPFFEALCDAYKKAMLRAFFVTGSSLVKSIEGDYLFTEKGTTVKGRSPIHVYKNSVISLPPNGNARRIPLCFLNGLDKTDLEITLKLNMGETYSFSRLGYGFAPFVDAVEKQIRAMREKAIKDVKDIDPSLTATQASQLAGLLMEGAAVPMGKVSSISASFAAAVEAKISQTRADEYYKAFKELCGPGQVWVGFKKNETRSEDDAAADDTQEAAGDMQKMVGNMQKMIGDMQKAFGGKQETPAEEEEEEPDPYLFWMIVPSPNGKYAAVEFAVPKGEAAATFVYRTSDFQDSAAQLNRALEAIEFRRELISMTEQELLLQENVDYNMAAKRTAALKFVRANFVGRVIHKNPETWKRDLTKMWSS